MTRAETFGQLRREGEQIMPIAAERPRRSVLVICDGLRADLLTPELTPHLWRLSESWCRFTDYRSMFPSVTRVCSASIATGCRPASHGLSGNTVALDEGDGLMARNVGEPDFRERLRRLRGHTLRRPTLAERLTAHGGAILFSNVSPGAAYFHDPDGFGHVYHRAGSYGPGLVPVAPGDALNITGDAEGDLRMTDRFCAEVLGRRRPAHAVLWLANPDKAGHQMGIGSPGYLQALAAADCCVAQVVSTLQAQDPEFADTLLMVGSDHGMETIRRLIPIHEHLAAAGLKESPESRDVVVAPNGTAALIYLAPEAAGRRDDIVAFLREQDWADGAYAGDELEARGLRAEHGLAIAVDMRHVDEPNAHGVRGLADAVLDPQNDSTGVGGGQHGGLGPNEQRPFLIACGSGFSAASLPYPARLIDLAPTILRFHGQPFDGTDGQPLPLAEEIEGR